MANNDINVINDVRIINTKATDYSWLDKIISGANGGKIELIIDGVTYTTSVSEDGKWSFTPPDDWAQGLHTVQLIAIDKATNRSSPTTFILNVDATPPAQPEIWRVVDNTGSEQGNLTPGDSTDEHKPVISGVAEPGSIVYLYDNEGAVAIGSVRADKMGAWTITPELADGVHSLTVVSEDATKNSSVKSEPFNLTITDGVVVAAENGAVAPVTSEATFAEEIGTLVQAGVKPTPLNKNQLTPSGTTDAGTLVQIIINNEVFTTRADAEGKWSFASPELADGTYFYQVRYQDRAGNWGAATQRIVEVDTSAPEAPQIMRVIDDVGSVDYLSFGQYTNDNTPTLNGVAQPGSVVYIYGAGAAPIGSVLASNDGRWTYTPELSADGTYVFSAAYEDRFGKMSPKSDNFSLILDTSVPGAPSDFTVFDDEGRVTGFLKSGDITDDTTPTLSGRADAGSIVRIWDGNTIIASTVADARGNWTIDLDLAEGEHNLRIDAQSKGGNTSELSDNFQLIVDTNILPPVQIEEVVANNGAEERPLKSGDATNDTSPVLRGSGNDGDIIYIIVNDEEVGSVVVVGGKWEFEVPAQEEGQLSLVVVVEDPATGKRSGESEPVVIEIDITAPEKPVAPIVEDNSGDVTGPVNPGQPIDDNQPIFKGEDGSPGDIVEIVIIDEDGNKSVIGTGIVGEDGSWIVQPDEPIADGEWEVEIGITDPAGNKSLPSDPISLIIDTKEPGALSEFELWDDVGAITGAIKDGDTTDDTSPTLRGKGENGSQVIVYQDGVEIGRATVANGEYSFQIPALAEGMHQISVQPVSASGVKGPISDAIGFEVDTTPPVVGTFTGVFYDTTGLEVPSPRFINDNTLIMKGTGADGTIVVIYGDAAHNQVIGSTVVQNGAWRFETPELADADYHFNVGFRDIAGNETALATSFDVEVDTVPPPPPEIDLFSAANLNDDLMHMSLNDILSQGNDSLFIDNGKTQLLVADNGQEVKLEDILPKGEEVSNWTQANGTVTVAGVEYNVYQNNGGDAEVMVPQHLIQEQH